MRRKLIIDGNAVYEIDDDCARRRQEQTQERKQRQDPDGRAGQKEQAPYDGVPEQSAMRACRRRDP